MVIYECLLDPVICSQNQILLWVVYHFETSHDLVTKRTEGKLQHRLRRMVPLICLQDGAL
jgi:hypothetical protein